MFSLFRIEDVFSIEPKYTEEEINQVLEVLLRVKYIDKVLHNVGLCVGLYDILEIKSKELLKGDGELRFTVIFRLICFQPFENEVIEGYVKSSDSNGITISLGFFENIRVNSSYLKEPKEFDEERKEWFWTYDGVKLFYKKNELIRIRIMDIYYGDPTDINRDEFSPTMSIMATVQQDGLGLVKWWKE